MVTDLFLVCADAQTLLFQICETNNLLLTQTISFKICVQMKKAFLLIEHVYFRFNTKAQIAFVVVCSESCGIIHRDTWWTPPAYRSKSTMYLYGNHLTSTKTVSLEKSICHNTGIRIDLYLWLLQRHMQGHVEIFSLKLRSHAYWQNKWNTRI